jgi:hypothetical protein
MGTVLTTGHCFCFFEVLAACVLAGCVSTQGPQSDPQQSPAIVTQSVAVAREAFETAVAEKTAPFWKLRVQYGQPGPACRRFGQLNAAEKQEKIARATSEHGPLQKEWDKEHQSNDRKIARATVLGGGLAGLGAALNARDEETVYASLGYQLWEVQDNRIDLSRPECGFNYTENIDVCGPTQYHRNDNEAFCRFIIDGTSLKQFWGESNDGMIADDKIREELDRAYDKYIVGHLDEDGPVDEARRRLSDAEIETVLMCEDARRAAAVMDSGNIDRCIMAKEANDSQDQSKDQEIGPPELVKRYVDSK